MENIGSGEDVKDLLDYYQSQSLPHVDAKFEAKSTLSSEVHGTFIEECFHPNNARSMEDIQSNLKAMESKGGAGASWAAETISTMANMSPTSMTITHRQLQEGSRMLQDKSMSDSSRLAACLEMEYRLAQRCMSHGDFREGIRALLVDKDHNPVWGDVPGNVEQWFEPVPYELVLEKALNES